MDDFTTFCASCYRDPCTCDDGVTRPDAACLDAVEVCEDEIMGDRAAREAAGARLGLKRELN